MYKIDNKNLRAKIKNLFVKTVVCFSGCLMSSASLQKLFCGVCSALKCSFEEFVREKLVFPSYSSAIFPSLSSLLFKFIPYTASSPVLTVWKKLCVYLQVSEETPVLQKTAHILLQTHTLFNQEGEERILRGKARTWQWSC